MAAPVPEIMNNILNRTELENTAAQSGTRRRTELYRAGFEKSYTYRAREQSYI
jgi:hypothetical protein